MPVVKLSVVKIRTSQWTLQEGRVSSSCLRWGLGPAVVWRSMCDCCFRRWAKMYRHCLRRCMAKDWPTFMILQVANTSVLVISKQISTVATEPILATMESKCCHANWLLSFVTTQTQWCRITALFAIDFRKSIDHLNDINRLMLIWPFYVKLRNNSPILYWSISPCVWRRAYTTHWRKKIEHKTERR